MQPTHPSNPDRQANAPDDVDRAFSHLTQLPPPPGFAALVSRAIAEERPVQLTAAWLVAGLACLGGVLLLAFAAGQVIGGSGLLDLLAFGADREVLATAPGEWIGAALDSVPWVELAGAFGLVILLVALQRRLGRSPTAATRAAGGA